MLINFWMEIAPLTWLNTLKSNLSARILTFTGWGYISDYTKWHEMWDELSLSLGEPKRMLISGRHTVTFIWVILNIYSLQRPCRFLYVTEEWKLISHWNTNTEDHSVLTAFCVLWYKLIVIWQYKLLFAQWSSYEFLFTKCCTTFQNRYRICYEVSFDVKRIFWSGVPYFEKEYR